MHEHIATPDYPDVVLAFTYRSLKIEVTACLYQEQTVYSAWVTYQSGSAVAVPMARTKEIAIAKAKQWINTQFSW